MWSDSKLSELGDYTRPSALLGLIRGLEKPTDMYGVYCQAVASNAVMEHRGIKKKRFCKSPFEAA